MFSKPNVIIYLRRNGLLIAGKRISPARHNFSTELVDNLEVLQAEKFIASCEQFFRDQAVHGKRVLLVLDPSIVFTKTIDAGDSGKPERFIKAFVETMPFDPGKRACVAAPGKPIKLYATNAELYQAIAEALHLNGVAKLLAITPAAAYQLGEGKLQLSAAIEQFVTDTKVMQDANFASVTPS